MFVAVFVCVCPFASISSHLSISPYITFFQGAGSIFLYDGDNLSRLGVVIVTINYRLSSLGYAVTDTNHGNYGIMDQRFALQWVQRNIKNFGGDPTRVTLFGESAGAMSTGIHLVSPKSKGLFHRAIMESNPAAWNYRDVKSASVMGNDLFRLLGCAPSNLACAQSKNLSDVLEATKKAESNPLNFARENWGHFLDGMLPWTPTIDGTDEFPMGILDAFSSGNYNKDIPTIIGTNQNEGVIFVWGLLDKKAADLEADALIAVLFGLTDSFEVLKRYPWPKHGEDARPVLSQIVTDYLFRCASRQIVSAISADGTNTFNYRYSHVMADKAIFKEIGQPECANVTCHAAELPMLFEPNPYWFADWYLNADETKLSNAFGAYWTSFAKSTSGDPNSVATPTWPMYNNTAEMNVILQTPQIGTESFKTWDNEICAFWDKVGYNF
jgi:carboxylesterase type B